jgi:hypothetical protein
MTPEKAVECIEGNWPDERYTMLREALTMAIAALKGKPAVSCSDCANDAFPLRIKCVGCVHRSIDNFIRRTSPPEVAHEG